MPCEVLLVIWRWWSSWIEAGVIMIIMYVIAPTHYKEWSHMHDWFTWVDRGGHCVAVCCVQVGQEVPHLKSEKKDNQVEKIYKYFFGKKIKSKQFPTLSSRASSAPFLQPPPCSDDLPPSFFRAARGITSTWWQSSFTPCWADGFCLFSCWYLSDF